ncbi:hypothetical protein C471_03608 [Halorubrum saccharovorum DSM 1137]|uniref:DUF7979 domain-containing protein n=1 Tax=Halorubrum saccharovorum DSM 1137 TaxID=1227484 RepID=M0E653_9EURY|nr:hypothetical protein [Halorubrum saccharovorum]ELZ42513.1 hypothetical protein C471_03608 [Halorubrum saccharovorum DSM 1137]
MRTRLAVAGLVAVGVLLMANPLYLPVPIGEPDPAYTHTVQPVESGSPVAGVDAPEAGNETADGVVDYADLDSEARAAFDRALDAEAGFGVEEPDERVDSLSYPAEPTLGDGLLVVEYEGERYEFWTRTVEREPGAVVAQRIAVQPLAFLGGFFAVLAAAALGFRERSDRR